jgi:hypothetical protein
MKPAAMNGVTSGSIPTRSAGATQVRHPTQEQLLAAKRYVDEKKRIAFARG